MRIIEETFFFIYIYLYFYTSHYIETVENKAFYLCTDSGRFTDLNLYVKNLSSGVCIVYNLSLSTEI